MDSEFMGGMQGSSLRAGSHVTIYFKNEADVMQETSSVGTRGPFLEAPGNYQAR